jgi:hypothetical protein
VTTTRGTPGIVTGGTPPIVPGQPPVTGPFGNRAGGPWYRRRATLVAVGVIAVIAVTVVTDLPQHDSRAADIGGDTTVMSEINSDVGPCSYALHETLTIYHDLTTHTLSKEDASQVPGLLRDDQAACSFTDDSIYQLSTIDVPGSASGKDLGQVEGTVTLWATSDALSAIEDVQTLSLDPSNAAARRSLAKAENELSRDRAQAEAELAAADRNLRTHLPALQLSSVPASV